MEDIDCIKTYAKKNDVPIMMDDGIDFICKYISQHNVKKILELGTAIGYSAMKFAQISEDIQVTTVEIDIDRYIRAIQNIKDNGLSHRIKAIHADALTLDLTEKFDLIFIDGAKAQYIKFFQHYKKNLKEHGVFISDNLSFHGMVDSENLTCSYATRKLVRKIKRYVDFLKDNSEFTTEFYSVGDGLAVSRLNS